MQKKISFVTYDRPYLDKSWEWLNDLEIKELTMTKDFTKQQQLAFFEKLHALTDYKLWGLNINNLKIGALGLKHITSRDAEYFGYIGEKEFWGKGLSSEMLDFAFKVAKELGLKRLYLKVSIANKRAIKAYLNKGFKIIKDDGEVILMEIFLEGN